MYYQNLINDSPMYDFVEQIAGRPVHREEEKKEPTKDSNIEPVKKPSTEPEVDEEIFSNIVVDANSPMPFEVTGDIESVIMESISLLKDFANQAETYEDLQNETIREVFASCLILRKRIAMKAEKFSLLVNPDIANISKILMLLDDVDESLGQFKQAYIELKNRKEGVEPQDLPKAVEEKKEEPAIEKDPAESKEEKKEAEEIPALAPPKRAPKRLIAPPTSSLHKLRAITQQVRSTEKTGGPTDVPIQKPDTTLDMDNLIKIDFKSEQLPKDCLIDLLPDVGKPSPGKSEQLQQ